MLRIIRGANEYGSRSPIRSLFGKGFAIFATVRIQMSSLGVRCRLPTLHNQMTSI